VESRFDTGGPGRDEELPPSDAECRGCDDAPGASGTPAIPGARGVPGDAWQSRPRRSRRPRGAGPSASQGAPLPRAIGVGAPWEGAGPPLFPGDDREFALLVHAVAQHCPTHGCPIVDASRACPVCAQLLSQSALSHLAWGRWLAPRLRAEEGLPPLAPAAP
jgi:hypothetical protein